MVAGKGRELGKVNQPALLNESNGGAINFKLFYCSSQYCEEVASCLRVVTKEFEGSHM